MPIDLVDIYEVAAKARRTVVIDTHRFHAWVHNYMAPGEHDEMHCHNEDQTFIVIDGECTMHFPDGGKAVITPGKMVTITGGSFYRLENSGDKPMIMVGNRSGSQKTVLKIDYETRQPVSTGEGGGRRRAEATA
ncbi:MAG: cupin domain-containing protein [Dehalococcoidia bacterium]|nr:cupin domain-containing protein [Dehalococcoidia bacterium]